jgi:L-ascorbate metabolism protein UlaG (beta-lactamase superfamily)
MAGLNILIDPVFADWLGPRPGMGPRRGHPPGVRWEDLPPIDAVLLTHNHWDHLEGPGIARLWHRYGCRVLVPLGNDVILRATSPLWSSRRWTGGRAHGSRTG